MILFHCPIRARFPVDKYLYDSVDGHWDVVGDYAGGAGWEILGWYGDRAGDGDEEDEECEGGEVHGGL